MNNIIPNALFREKTVKSPYLVYNRHFCSYHKGKTLGTAKTQVWQFRNSSKSIGVTGRMASVGLMDGWIDR